MGRTEFVEQLRSLVGEVEDLGDGKIAFTYTILTGNFAGKSIRLGFQVPEDFPLSPPSGPHISPRLLPNQSGGSHPSGGIHNSAFGQDWHYWSRPIPNWKSTKRTVRDVLAHIRHLFDTA
ncbi:MAG: hypothetical protein PHV55_04705 [Candidatus Omnitrophica bacterium]|nr:hypothetical protein [Candidatus Omnitrophota bacterium]